VPTTKFLYAAREFAKGLASDYRCPCKIWIANSLSSDPQGFGLVEERDGRRHFVGYYWDGSGPELTYAWHPHYDNPSDSETKLLEKRVLEMPGYSGPFR
jgi:hypothetical protein